MDEIQSIVKSLHDKLAPLSDEERLVVFSMVSDGYCVECGKQLSGEPFDFCYCTHMMSRP